MFLYFGIWVGIDVMVEDVCVFVIYFGSFYLGVFVYVIGVSMGVVVILVMFFRDVEFFVEGIVLVFLVVWGWSFFNLLYKFVLWLVVYIVFV